MKLTFLPGQYKRENWNFYIFWILEKLKRCYYKTKISAHLKFSTKIPTFLIFQRRECFWKFVKKILKIWHFSRDSVKGKIESFTFSRIWKVATLLLQNQNISAQEIFSHNSHLPLLSAKKKVFENSLNTFEDMAFLLGQCKGKNWNFYFFWILEKL